MSKQLAISSAISVFAMMAFAVLVPVIGESDRVEMAMGAPISIEAPTLIVQLPAMPYLPTIN